MKKVKNLFYFDNVQDAIDWLMKLDGKDFEVVCGAGGSYSYLVDAFTIIQKSIVRSGSASASLTWYNNGPGAASVELRNISTVRILTGSISERLESVLSGMTIGQEIELNVLDFPANNVRSAISAKRMDAYTRMANGRLYLIKGEKQRSDAQIIRDAVEAIKGSSAEIELDFDPAYVRTVISKMNNKEYRYSVKHFPHRSAYLITKIYYDAGKHNNGSEAEFSREYVESILSPLEAMAFFGMLERLKAGNISEADTRPVQAVAPAYVPAPAAAVPAPAAQALDVDDFLPTIKPAKGKVEHDTRDLDDIIASDDRDTYDARILKTDYISEYFKDDEDLDF